MNERYEIRRKIGQGGLGTVYQAFDNQLKREVAIKRLFAPVDVAGRVDRESTADKLMREATALSRLNHPNIVSVFDVGVDADGGFVVMELLSGETLTETIAKGTLTLVDFHQVVIQTLEALIAAEAQTMLHRDLKPSNIMLIWLPSGRFLIKVLDFGLAKVSAQPALQTIDQNNSVLGSIFYMAPEQFERKELDFRTDLYSMGCIYYFCLAGTDPFTGRSVADVMNAHLEHRVVPLHEIRPDLPRLVCDWVMWLLAREMERRPQTAKQALDSFPLAEGAGGAVQVVPEREATIARMIASSSAKPAGSESPRSSLPPSNPAASRTASSPVNSPASPRAATSGTRLPPSRNSGPTPTRTTTGARIPAGPATSSTPTRTTSSTRIPPAPIPSGHTGATSLGSPARDLKDKRGKPLPVALAVIGVVALCLVLAVVSLSRRNSSIPSLTYLTSSPVGEGDEIQLSFQVRRQSPSSLRFALIQPDQKNSKIFHGYAFDIEERQPVSLSSRCYSGEPASKVHQVSLPAGLALKTSLSGSNITPSLLSKVELRGKMTAAKTIAFTLTLWGKSGQKGIYTVTDGASPLTAVQVYGFRGVRTVVDQVTDKKFTIARAPKTTPPPKPAPSGSGTSDPAALGLAVLLNDSFDGGKNPGTGDEADVPLDGGWQQNPWLAKPDPAKKVNNINGSNALGIASGKSTYTSFPSVQLIEGRLIETGFACRIDDSIDAIRLVLVNKPTESRGYLVEISRQVKITLHEFRGQHAKDFPLEVCRQVHEMTPPSFNPRLSQAYQIRLSVMRLKDNQARVQITLDFPGGKNANTAYTDTLVPAPSHFTTFGVKTRGKKGKILLDEIRIVSSMAPAG